MMSWYSSDCKSPYYNKSPYISIIYGQSNTTLFRAALESTTITSCYQWLPLNFFNFNWYIPTRDNREGGRVSCSGIVQCNSCWCNRTLTLTFIIIFMCSQSTHSVPANRSMASSAGIYCSITTAWLCKLWNFEYMSIEVITLHQQLLHCTILE